MCDSMGKILIKNGRVWDGERFFDADVLTDGEQIAQIRPNITEPAEFVYDAKGKSTCGTAIAVPFFLPWIDFLSDLWYNDGIKCGG